MGNRIQSTELTPPQVEKNQGLLMLALLIEPSFAPKRYSVELNFFTGNDWVLFKEGNVATN